jgi:hypothetical protein
MYVWVVGHVFLAYSAGALSRLPDRVVWVVLEFNKSSAFYEFKNHVNILKSLMWRCALTSVPQASLKQGTDKQ